MSQYSRLLFGVMLSFIGWIGLIIATATNDWVMTCKYGLHTCKKMDELGSKGLWAECVVSTALYHCKSLNQVIVLPAYILTARGLMIAACIAGFPSLVLILLSLPCVRLPNEIDGAKRRRALIGGALMCIMALCGLVSTVWFPVAAHKVEHIVSFGFSLYCGWVGSGLCLLGGVIMTCCTGDNPSQPRNFNRFSYSKRSTAANSVPLAANHAKNVHV